jgi:hypothetical protein
MFRFEFTEELARRPRSPLPDILQSLPNTLVGIGSRRNIEQSLVRCRVLYDGSGPAFYGKHYRPLALLQVLDKIAGSPSKCSQGLNVFRNIKHEFLRLKHLFRCS